MRRCTLLPCAQSVPRKISIRAISTEKGAHPMPICPSQYRSRSARTLSPYAHAVRQEKRENAFSHC
eukprot:410095-Rhodomonas_salina.3